MDINSATDRVSYDQGISQLKSMFPKIEIEIIESVLEQSGIFI